MKHWTGLVWCKDKDMTAKCLGSTVCSELQQMTHFENRSGLNVEPEGIKLSGFGPWREYLHLIHDTWRGAQATNRNTA
jgi:hypothetical protein